MSKNSFLNQSTLMLSKGVLNDLSENSKNNDLRNISEP
jgi:hypothetical protein